MSKHYKTGTYISSKSTKPVNYKSSWELAVAKWLDAQEDVVRYSYEPFTLPYVSNFITGQIRQYYPDFLVEYSDGSWLLVEVKREDKVKNRIVQKKKLVAEQWCKNLLKQGKKAKYELWTDQKIKTIKEEVLKKETSEQIAKKSTKKKQKKLSPLTEEMKNKLLPFRKKKS